MRLVFVTFLLMLAAAPSLRADENDCFGPERIWCAWTTEETGPDGGWRVVHTSRLDSATIETVIDSPGNRPRLGIRVLPATESHTGQAIISLRPDDRPKGWSQYVGRNREFADGAMRFSLGRRALESVLQAPASAMLFIFVEVRTPGSSEKISHKIPLRGLSDALRFARLGR